MRYELRTLLILLAILPPLLGVAWVKYAEWKAEQERQEALAKAKELVTLKAIQLPPQGKSVPMQSTLERGE